LIYSDETASQSNRLKAAGLALAHETPRLAPVQQLELKAEGPAIPLADLVTQRRARMDRILALPLEERSELFSPSRRNSGNGNDDTAG
jgi:hypothetical protein